MQNEELVRRRQFLRQGFVCGLASAGLLTVPCLSVSKLFSATTIKPGPIKSPKEGERLELSIKGVDYAFRWCPPGTFMMGSPTSEAERRFDDETQHQVILTRGFWLLETPVSQTMWEGVMGANPSSFKGDKLPAERVLWEDCQEYIEKLNDLKVAPAGFKFSLPTESQWEYACRAGTTTPFNFGSVLNGDKANCIGTCPYGTTKKGTFLRRTTKPGTYPANAWGLYDMHGNVWEWCSDWYGDYPSGVVTDPVGPSSNSCSYRVLRGGGWEALAGHCRSALRSYEDQSERYSFIGARLALVFEGQAAGATERKDRTKRGVDPHGSEPTTIRIPEHLKDKLHTFLPKMDKGDAKT